MTSDEENTAPDPETLTRVVRRVPRRELAFNMTASELSMKYKIPEATIRSRYAIGKRGKELLEYNPRVEIAFGKTATELSREYGIPRPTIIARANAGRTPDEIIAKSTKKGGDDE